MSAGVSTWPLATIPTLDLTSELQETLDELALPQPVDAMLTSPLIRIVALLEDSSQSNDVAICHQLTSFLDRVDIQEDRGQLSPDDADALRLAATAVQVSLACPAP